MLLKCAVGCGLIQSTVLEMKKKLIKHSQFSFFEKKTLGHGFLLFTPQPLRAVGVLFSPMVSGWVGGLVGGRQEKVCPGCISETVRCRKLILGRDIG